MGKEKEKKSNEEIRDLWDVDDPIDIDTPLDDAVYIDMEEISKKAEDETKLMFRDLERVYSNEQFMNEHPEYKKRLDIEIESLRIQLKMRKSDELIHDILVKQIGMTPNNASLYAALNRMQASMINIQTKLDQTVKNINQLLKNYQLEIPFEGEKAEVAIAASQNDSKTDAKTFRGTKAFMNHIMNKNQTFYPIEDDNLPGQLDLFEDEEQAVS